MNHLTEEQFEDIMQGSDVDLTHLSQCKDCQNALAEKKAIAARLRCAFASVKAGNALAERIRSRLESVEPVRHKHVPRLHHKLWTALTAAAAILIILVPLSFYFSSPSSATASQAELVKIHEQNLDPLRKFFNDADPEKLAKYFKDELGFTPAFLCTGQGLAIKGCCVAHFKGRIVGSYVVDTPKGTISIIAVTDTPKKLGMTPMPAKIGDQRNSWKSSYAQNNMVAVRLGDYSYCAVGEISNIPHEHLRALLSRLLPNTQR